jgi:hypothetical protein
MGQSRRFGDALATSGLPRTADTRRTLDLVEWGQQQTHAPQQTLGLFDQLVGAGEHVGRHLDAQRSHEKIFTDALRLALNRIDPNKDKRKKVNMLAEKLVECAIEDKQAWAFQQIADRLEGKPVQVVDATVDDHRTLDQFSDAELTAILRRRVGVMPVESDEERPAGEALN